MPLKKLDPVVIGGGILTLVAALAWNQVGSEIVKMLSPGSAVSESMHLCVLITYAIVVSLIVMILVYAHNRTCEALGITTIHRPTPSETQ